MRLKNKVAIVTGAASGIGRAIADLFVSQGAKVIYSDIHKKINDFKVSSKKAIYVPCDVSNQEEVKALIARAKEVYKGLDVMVNNAGVGGLGGILEVQADDFERTLKINLFGVFYGTQAAAQAMKKEKVKGNIINISSILGTVGMEQTLAYCTSKGGVGQLTRAASLDLAKFGIRVNAIAPAFIKTKMTKDILHDKKFNQMVISNTPLAYVGEPKDIANAALYLASDEAKYVTGTTLHVDGGWTIH